MTLHVRMKQVDSWTCWPLVEKMRAGSYCQQPNVGCCRLLSNFVIFVGGLNNLEPRIYEPANGGKNRLRCVWPVLLSVQRVVASGKAQSQPHFITCEFSTCHVYATPSPLLLPACRQPRAPSAVRDEPPHGRLRGGGPSRVQPRNQGAQP